MTEHDKREASPIGIEMRQYMRKHRAGVLSTHSQKLAGYLRFFVQPDRLTELGDFTFWRLSPRWIRLIGDFGRITG